MKNLDYNAGKLLAVMRPKVEKILDHCAVLFGDKLSTAPSQSLRAKQAIELLEQTSKMEGVMGGSISETRMNRIRWRITLHEFLAVHTTVSLIERGAYTGKDEE